MKASWKEFTESDQMVTDPDYAISFLDKFFDWGVARNITQAGGATAVSQVTKLLEEIGELKEALEAGDEAKALDGLGDSIVVLVQISRLAGLSWEDAMIRAWEDIEHRKGRMHCGVFIKQDDLDLIDRNGQTEELANCTDAQQVKDLIDRLKRFEEQV